MQIGDHMRDVVIETHECVYEKVKLRLDPRSDGSLMFFTAETGLGKTTGELNAICRVWNEMSPQFRFLIMVPTRKDADILWTQIERNAPGKAAVWTATHDPSKKEPDKRFVPSVFFTKHEAAQYPCLIITHNAGKAAEGWVGKRHAVLIDEYPSPVSSGSVEPWQFTKARDDEQTTPFKMASVWAEEQDQTGLVPVGLPDWVDEVVKATPKTDVGRDIQTLAQHMLAGTAFQRRINKTTWHWYKYDLPFEEKAIVFSATAHLEGWHFDPVHDGQIDREDIKVSYENMVAKYHPWPEGVSRYHKQIVRSPAQLETILSYVAEKVGERTDNTLVVCPLDLEEHFSKRLPGAKVTHYGCDVGSNEYRDCDRVFLVSLFHQTGGALLSKYLGHAKQDASEKSLEPGKNSQGDLNRKLRRLHHSTHIKQMGARGTCRHVDANGVADRMELHCIFPDVDDFTTIVPVQFDKVTLVYEDGFAPSVGKPNRDKIAATLNYLICSDKDVVTAPELRAAGIKAKGSAYSRRVSEEAGVFSSQGWEFIQGEAGRYGRPTRFRRI